MGRTRTRGAAVLKEGRGGGRLAAYKCVRMCVCQVTRCGGAPCVYPVWRARQRGGEMQPKHFTGACPVLEFAAFRAVNFRANPRFPRFRGGKGCDEERIVSSNLFCCILELMVERDILF